MAHKDDRTPPKLLTLIAVLGVMILGVITITAVIVPKYRVWQQGLRGEAALREAEFSKKVAVEEAKAEMESASLKAQAEVERAKGVAEANQIIGDSLRGNEAYLRYLWIQGLHDGSSETVYIPTEAGLPILEAARKAPTAVRGDQ